jgi:hypothetical protein
MATGRRWVVCAAVLAVSAVTGTAHASAEPSGGGGGEPVQTGEPVTVPMPPVPITEPLPEPIGMIPPIETLGSLLAQSGTDPAGPLGLPELPGYGVLLGQNTLPVAPGDVGPATIPNLNVYNPEYLLGQNITPAAPGEGTAAPGIGPSPDSPGTGRVAFLRRLHEMYQAGLLTGALLGQNPPEPAPAG